MCAQERRKTFDSERTYPTKWIRDVSPKTCWEAGRVLTGVNALFNWPSSKVASFWIALIAGCLFDSSDDALRAPTQVESRGEIDRMGEVLASGR